MARAIPSPEKSGLVVGLCPDVAVYERLASAACDRGLGDSSVRAAGTGATLRAACARVAGGRADCDLLAWTRELHHIDYLEVPALLDEVGDDPLLEACFMYLAKMPGGGAPWQGSWRGNALNDVLVALGKGGIILVVEARSLEEQRDWARTLLKSGCAFVQTHDGAAAPEFRT